MNRDKLKTEVRRLGKLAGEPALAETLIAVIDDAIYDANSDGYYEGLHANEEY